MAKNCSEIIWITWENQRRTNELSRALDVPLCKYLSSRSYLARVLFQSARTSLKLLITRPKIVIVQNPSIILATLACLLRPLLRFSLVVDRHSNFKFNTMKLRSLKYKIFHILSKFTVRKADLTIVTNEFLKEVVEGWGGRGFVLPDKLPLLPLAERIDLAGKNSIVFVCSYSGDEPVTEVIEGARSIDPFIVIHITGDSRKLKRNIVDNAPPNVIFTGFLGEKDYQSLLYSCDAVMVLTKQEHTLVCGAYEAVSLGKPLILSHQEALRNYFNKGVVFTENRDEAIAQAIQRAIGKKAILENEIMKLAEKLRERWDLQFNHVQELLESL